MSGARQGPVLSPVDYDAWNRGYMPPTEHVLIDALAFRDAKVITMSSDSKGAIYVVTRGKPTDKRMRAILMQLLEAFDDAPDAAPSEAETALADPTPPLAALDIPRGEN